MAGEGAGFPEIGPLYMKTTSPRADGTLDGAINVFGALSQTSQFKVSLHLSTGQSGINGGDSQLITWLKSAGLTTDVAQNTYYDFFCSEASLPGATFDITEEAGSRQGVIEKFPMRRIYPEFTMTFYVDNDYRIIRLFEEWMNYINPVYTSGGIFPVSDIGQGGAKDRNNFFKMKYPDTYKRIISITKFERNFRENPAIAGGKLGNVPSITYRMIDAFPTNITALPLSYEGSTITKTTVTFDYSRYVIERNKGTLRV
jgi:hypothetical protein